MCVCRICSENWPAAMYKETDLCRNHAVLSGVSKEPYREIIKHCPTCGAGNVPAQWHHLASERQQQRHMAFKYLGILLCLNCHGILTDRQSTAWDPSWKTENHPVRCTIQGTYDVLWLLWERSRACAGGTINALSSHMSSGWHSSPYSDTGGYGTGA